MIGIPGKLTPYMDIRLVMMIIVMMMLSSCAPRSGRLFLVDAVIDGVSGNLVFDTGASGLVLNRNIYLHSSL
jgi:hypothetical protein